MDLLLLIARLILAGVFLVAGVTKLADRRGSIQALRDFGIPASVAVPLGSLLPLAELAVAMALVTAAAAWWGALEAAILLLAFMLGIGVNLARGNHPECHCFGQLHASPAGWPTLARNGVLVAIALVIVSAGRNDVGPSAVAWLEGMSAMHAVTLVIAAVALVLLAVEGWTLIHIVAQNGQLMVRLDALEAAGSRQVTAIPEVSPLLAASKSLPPFALTTLAGETTNLESLPHRMPSLLLLTDPTCAPCNGLMPDVRDWQQRFVNAFKVVVIGQGDAAKVSAMATEHGITNVFLQPGKSASEAMGVHRTPCAVLVDSNGQIRGEATCGAPRIRDLVASLARSLFPATNHQDEPVSRIGQLVPMTRATDLEGKQRFVGGPSTNGQLFVFWNPGCGFCQRMLPDFKRMEREWPQSAPELVVISQGTAEANRAQDLQSLVVLDEAFGIGRSVGASGTPSGILIDARGRIASPLMVGADAVLSLASPV